APVILARRIGAYGAPGTGQRLRQAQLKPVAPALERRELPWRIVTSKLAQQERIIGVVETRAGIPVSRQRKTGLRRGQDLRMPQADAVAIVPPRIAQVAAGIRNVRRYGAELRIERNAACGSLIALRGQHASVSGYHVREPVS